MKPRTLLLEASDLCSIIERIGRDRFMSELVERLSGFTQKLRPGQTQVPPRSGVQYSDPYWGLFETMPAYCANDGTTIKLVGYHPHNPTHFAKPSVVSTIAVFDPETGELIGLMDGTLLTAIRTGAASAVASRILAKPSSKTLGIIGCGAQAITQVHALSQCFDIETVIAYDIDDRTTQSLPQRLEFLTSSPEVHPVSKEQLGNLLEQSDILCTCTSSIPGEGPVIDHFRYQPSLHINAVGSDFPEKFELPLSLLKESLVVPDFREQAIVEGECQQLDENEIGPDFTELVQNADGFAQAQDQLTVFDSTGWALEDHIVAQMVLTYAKEMKIGNLASFESSSPDPKDPYSVFRSLPELVHTQ